MKTTLVLIITTRCNFKCKHCLRDYYTKQYDLPLDLIEKALNEASELGFKHIAITGGEAILYPNFSELIDLIVEKGFSWSIVTNGFFYKKYDSVIEKHKDKLKFIAISLDGGKEETHDYIRQKGSFKKVKEAAKYFVEKNIFVRLIYTVNSRNINEIEDFIKLALELKVNAVRLAGIIPTEFNQDLRLEWEQKVRVYNYLQELKKQNLGLEITNTTSLFSVTDAEKFCGNINDHEPAINAYGEYIFCCDTIGQGAVLGDLKEKTFSELYILGLKQAAALKKERIRRIINKEFFKDFNSCHFCNTILAEKIKNKNK
ncbi:MAG: radical SAM/SPASM domain-containing protein [Candidatus Woesearchaeota archaeon]